MGFQELLDLVLWFAPAMVELLGFFGQKNRAGRDGGDGGDGG